MYIYILIMFFFFQAEDGIRDYKVTGVQTCALPISSRPPLRSNAEGIRARRPGQCSGGRGPVRSVGGLSQGTARLRSASPFTPVRSAGPVRSVGGLSQGTTRLRSACRF